jgi:hypothetical protein
MALYHLTAKTGSRASGQSALAKAQYIQREDRYARVPDRVVYTTSGNLPGFAAGSASAYFEAADLYERANGRLFKEVEFALPVELEPDEQRELAMRFAGELLAGETLPYTLAIHEGRGHNPHCHVLVSERVNDGVERPASQWFRRWNARDPELGGARKSIALRPKEWLEQIRETWAGLVNQALERAGFLERVDHRSLAAQGIDRIPQVHVGLRALRMEERGILTERGDQALRIQRSNVEIDELRAQLRRVERAERETRGEPELSRSQDLHGERSSVEPPDSRGREPHRGREDREEIAAATGRHRADGALEPSAATSAQVAKADLSRTPPASGADPVLEPQERRPMQPGLVVSGVPRSAAVARERGEPTDRTARAVERQLRAIGGGAFEVGVRSAATGLLMQREGSTAEVLGLVPWLKRMNAQGHDIFVRPARERSQGVVLLDDVSRSTLRALERDGRSPAAIVETSPGNYQAWIRVAREAPAGVLGRVSRSLARDYDADPAAVGVHRYGRLAGFTNQKEQHRTAEGLQPFALLRGASGRTALDGPALLREAGREVQPERSLEVSRGRASDPAEAAQIFGREVAKLARTISDPSRCDFGAALRLAERGFNAYAIAHAIRTASPRIEERKPGHVQDYAVRTAESALRAHSRALQRDRERDRGWER